MAGISRKKITKNGKITIKYTITYRDIFGKQHTSGLYDTYKEAKSHLSEFERIKKNEDLTYGKIFKLFLEKTEKTGSINTLANYSTYCERFLSGIYQIKYSKINSISWQNFFNEIAHENSAHVAQSVLKFAKAAINYAVKHNLVEYNILNKIEKPKAPPPDINHLTIDEQVKILDLCKKAYPQYFALLYTFVGSGAREGEIFALEKDDFNYSEKSLKISKQFTRNRLILKPKTEHSNRVIYLFDELADVIKEHTKTLDKNNPLLFPNKAGNYINPSNFRVRFFYPLLKLAGIEKRVRVHDLRGSYIDLVLSSGLSVKFAQNQAGHAKSETTLNIYAKNNEDMIKNAQNRIENIFSGKCENFVRKNKRSDSNKIIQFPKRADIV